MPTDTSIADRELPDSLADRFQPLLVTPDRPTTYGEWVDATVATLDDTDFTLDVDALCLTEASPHRVTVDGEVRCLRCVLDALLVPFVVEAADPVEVRTRCPVTGTEIAMAVSRDGVSATPPEVVVSFGVAGGAPSGSRPDPETHPLRSYERFCPYINAFADESAYADWDAERATASGNASRTVTANDVATTALAVPEAFELAELLADGLTNGGGQQ